MFLVSLSPFLRRVLVADALVSAAAGMLMALGAGWLQDLLALPSGLLLAAGLALFPWAAALLWLAREREVPRAAVWAVIVLNVLWIAESIWVAVGGSFHPNALGEGFIAAQALAVAVLAELEFIGLKRSTVAFA